MTPLFAVAFDGFRWDYAEQYNLANFKRLAAEGARVAYVKPIFPSLTFPNFYAIATGRYAENHGVVGNRFCDPSSGKQFSLADDSQKETHWYTSNDCEPFWITAKKSGLKVGSSMWPMSAVQFTDCDGAPVVLDRLVEYAKLDDPKSYLPRVDACLEWIMKDQLDMTLLYFDEPDLTAHRWGPESDAMAEMLKLLDEIVGYLLDKLDEHGLRDILNLLFMSDHGAAQTDKDRRMHIRDLLPPLQTDDWIIYDTGSIMTIKLRDGATLDKALLEQLRKSSDKIQVYSRDEIPERYRFRKHERSPDILIVCDEHYCLYNNDVASNLGKHGYDNETPSMRGILYARGPAFRSKGFVTESHVDIIDNYRLLCKLVGITPRPNDSTANTIFTLLRD